MDILERFQKYIAIDTMSSETSGTHPSSPTQTEFAKVLLSDLKELGVTDCFIDEHSYVYASIKNNSEKTIGLISHMDTSCALIGGIKNPRLIKNYDGKDIVLNDKYTMKVEEFKTLKDVVGEDLLVTDGEHLLGGDDKAGIAIIFEFLTYYISHKDEFNYNLAICFTPDEEIGEGPMFFDVSKLGADIAYTLDGESIYEASYENFYASSSKVTIYGVGVHPGMAYGVMINSSLLASEFISLLPKNMTPSTTKDYEGFIHLCNVNGDVEKTTLGFIIRDFEEKGLRNKEQILLDAKKTILKRYPKAKIDISFKDEYKNMKPLFIKDMRAINLINKAYLNKKLKISYSPIRGGTDGATISYMGVNCPNLGVGDFNPHGRFEFVSVTQMRLMVEILKEMFKE